MTRLFMAFTLLFTSAMVCAGPNGGGYPMPPMAVPTDSPYALAGLAIILAIVSIRLLRKRR